MQDAWLLSMFGGLGATLDAVVSVALFWLFARGPRRPAVLALAAVSAAAICGLALSPLFLRAPQPAPGAPAPQFVLAFLLLRPVALGSAFAAFACAACDRRSGEGAAHA